MSTFNADIYIGNRGNTILSFDLYLGTGTTQNYNCSPDSGVTFNTFIHSGTTRVFQDIQWNNMYSGQTLFVDNIPIGTTHIKVVANRLSGVCNNLQPQIICIQGRPTPTPTPSSTPTSTPTPTPSPTTSPTPTATDIPPTPTPTPTATVIPPTPTPTPTTSPTPTPTENIDVDPSYFYYALGDCSDMRYVYTSYTTTGFSPIIAVPGCATLSEIGTLSMQNPAQTSYVVSNPLDPCGFGTGYTGVGIARSTNEITEGTVYNVGNLCLSVISVLAENVTGWTVNLDGLTPVGIGDIACASCSPPFTGFTISGYSGVTCGDPSENVIAYSLLGGFTLGNVYGIQMYSGGTATSERICMTLNANLGPQFVIEDPLNEGLSGYQISDTGPTDGFTLPTSGYTNCSICDGVVQKYMIVGERCDTTGGITLWSDTPPTVVSGDTMSVNIFGTIACFLVTRADQFTSVVYNDLGDTIIDTGCDCNGNSGGANVNVDNILATVTNAFPSGGECQSPQSENYTETIITEMQLTFRDSSNNPIIPNQPVQYRENEGTYQSLTVTGTSVNISVSLAYGDNTACTNGGVYAGTLDVKVGTLTILSYTAGSS